MLSYLQHAVANKTKKQNRYRWKYCHDSGSTDAAKLQTPDGDSYADNAYRRLIKEELGVSIESAFEANGDDYTRQVSLAIASGDLPDVMVVSRDEMEELADNDLIADLTDVYEEYASDNIKIFTILLTMSKLILLK